MIELTLMHGKRYLTHMARQNSECLCCLAQCYNIHMDQKAHTIKKLFSRETIVAVNINATPEKLWQVLTNLNDYKNWNSTIVSIRGEMRVGGKVELVSTLDPKRTFKLNVKTFEPHARLVWGDMMGSRTFTVEKKDKGTVFTMTEKIGGPLFPLFSKMIPSFDESFDSFAKDLKIKAEMQ